MTRKPKSDYAIQTVTNALRLLDVFRRQDEIGVADLARELDLHKNNVFRLLATMEECGYIEQSPSSDKYRLGIAIHALGQAFTRSRPLLARALPILENLRKEIGETVHLAIRDDFEVVHLLGLAPEREISTAVRTGRRLPVHCTALGKVLLGCSPERAWREFDEKVAKRGKLVRYTERTIEDSDKFFEHLRTVAGHGYALDFSELEDGLACAAAPVFGGEGELLAALSVSAPLFRVGEEAILGDLRKTVVLAAESLSEALGYNA
jgi:DNA-binding IclR family transcriptional regulator